MSIQGRLRAASTARESDARLLCVQAASALDAKDAEIERLREALSDFLENPSFKVAVGGNPIAVERMLAKARSALTPPHPEQWAVSKEAKP